MILFALCWPVFFPFCLLTLHLAMASSAHSRTRVNFESQKAVGLEFAAVAHIDRVFSPRVDR